MQRLTLLAVKGGILVNTNGQTSTTIVEGSFPGCTVSVFNTGTTNLATIYGDNLNPPTPKSNPFTADANGFAFFYAPNGSRVDVQLSGTGIASPFVVAGDVLFNDPAIISLAAPVIVPFSATPAFDLSLASWFQLTLTGNVTGPTFPNAAAGNLLVLSLIQDPTGGRTFAFPGSFLHPPTIDTTASSHTELTFKFDGTTWTQFAATADNTAVPGNLSVGGSLLAKNLEGVRYADQFPGGDLGAKINAAAADAGASGIVIIPPGISSTSITTALNLPAGTCLNFPPGTFSITAGHSISNVHISILGSGLGTTLQPTSGTGDIFTITGGDFNIGGMTVLPSVTRTAGAFLNIQTQIGNVHDIAIVDMFDGFVQGTNASSVVFRNIYALGVGGNWHNVFRNGPLASGTIPGTVIDNFVIVLSSGGSTISGDLFVLDSGTDSTKINALEISRTAGADSNIGFRVQKTGAAQAPSFITMVNSYCETRATNICVQIDNANFFSSENFGFALGLTALKITGGNGITFHDGFATLCQQGAVSITGGNGVMIQGMKISDCAQAGANSFDAISVAAGVIGFSLTENRIGNYAFGGNTFRNGVTVAAGASDRYVITGNSIDGFGTSAVSDGGAGVNKTVQVMGGGLTGYGTSSGTSASLIAEGAGGNAATFEMFNNSANADSKWWEIIGLSGAGTLIFRTLSDNFGVQVPWLTVTRSGTSPTGIQTGCPITSYSNIATAGQGIAPIYGATSQKAESAADANVLTFTPPAVAGTYRLRFVLSISAAASAVVGWTASWTDSNGSARTPANLSLFLEGTAAPALTTTTSAVGNYYGDATIDINNAAANIVIKFTLASGTITAKASATIERLI